MKNLTLFIALLAIPLIGVSQNFVPRTVGYSKKKTAYIFKSDGTKITCTIAGLTWKKGNIDGIKVKNLEGEKIKLSPEEISHMYLPPSALSAVSTAIDFMDDVNSWGDTDLDKSLLGEKLSYYEKTDVKIKKKTFKLMMQVLNPTFCTNFRVYSDPMAKESVTGEEKSYYIKKKGDAAAYVLKRADFKEAFKLLFSDCSAVIEKYGTDLKWREFEKHVFEFDKSCK